MTIFAFGSNGAGQLGIGHRDDVHVPIKHIPPQEAGAGMAAPVAVAAGGNHTLMLFSSGHVSITGSKQGMLGEQGNFMSQLLAHNIKLCSATWDACILCTKQNSIFTYGRGGKGELGRGPNTTEALIPSQSVDISSFLLNGASIVDLASSIQHTVLVLSNGQVIGWGNGRKGQLGEPAEVVWKPRKIQGIGFAVHRAVCGREFTYLVGAPGDGSHLILGSDKWGVRSAAPRIIPFWKDIGASWSSIFILQGSGEMAAWGRNDHGQLPRREMPKITKMAIGSEHVVTLSVDGRVLAWGWGEHGNCGPTTDDHGDVKETVGTMVIPGERVHSIMGVGAGCATSWIWSLDSCG